MDFPTAAAELAPQALPAPFFTASVASYYDRKTASILDKYGPGPRVHFHIGYFEGHPDIRQPASVLRERIRAGQEAVMEKARLAWDAERAFAGRLLDVGCGLGGGSIYWAEHCVTNVTSVTIAPEHLAHIARYAREAGVGGRVHPILSDACEVQAPEPFDAVVAMESSCYLPRARWFQHLRTLLRPGGVVCIEDTFLGRPECRVPFDRYWRTQVGPVDEYVRCAAHAGFSLESNVDLSAGTAEFWRQSMAWTDRILESGGHDEAERERLRISLPWHEHFHRMWLRRGIEVRLLKFRLTSGGADL
ncbi:MAG TPA: methyltransferase domain-containing protein [Pseudoxanthomonas sp.]